MKVKTPFGDYPFEFRRLERRGTSIAVIGTPAGLETSVMVGLEDLRTAARRLAPVAAACLLIIYLRAR
jgi:hypothetical protein